MALKQAIPLLSRSDLGLHSPLASPSCALQIVPLSSGLTTEAPHGFQMAPKRQASTSCATQTLRNDYSSQAPAELLLAWLRGPDIFVRCL